MPPSPVPPLRAHRRSPCWLILVLVCTAGAAQAETESEPLLPAVDLVAPELLAGPGWNVRAMARIHGYQARFVIDTDWGTLEAESVGVLAQRVAEMPAIPVVQDATVTGVLGEAGLDQVSGPARALWNVVSNPVDAVVGLPEGVLRYFGERLRRIRDRATKLGDRAGDHIFGNGSPYRDADAPMSAWRAPLPDAEGEDEEAWWADNDVSKESVRLVKGELRFNRLRREIAARLGVDAGTDNPLIRPRLDRLAWMATIGRIGVDRIYTVLTAGASDVLGTAGTIDSNVLSLPDEDARARNDERLGYVCADPELRYDFLWRGRFSSTQQTLLVDRLLRLAPAEGCEALLETALMARSGIETRFVLDALGQIERHFGDAGRGGRFVPQGAILAYLTPGNEFVLPLPVDYLSWTPQMQEWFDSPGIGDHPYRTVLVGGRVSDLAERELTVRGWSIVSRAPYPDAPPYATAVLAPSAPATTALQ
ncbi:hypothetical protein [Coralloluteibacterium stylophorae]|uniref:DUF1598 domain-containing protein n=1 Tax=Coralloluteibacterium stylophorae TaxID=1776034 RepID=A0A8J7VYH2_9GAMM|nr:hypothetical protein [Coralloluteibacterium stylophorae]MBS7456540.1 hypothetical protein [Coralloluteibacterium stylophorae]